jgi:hypothetical protein
VKNLAAPAAARRHLPAGMNWKRKMHGGLLGFIGFMLSPLSWWNDLFVNVPLAVGFAWIVSLFYKPAFGPAVIVGYWMTNVAGLLLMHKGARKAFGTGETQAYTRRDLLKDIAISFFYTLLILLLVKLRFIQPLTDYLQAQ